MYRLPNRGNADEAGLVGTILLSDTSEIADVRSFFLGNSWLPTVFGIGGVPPSPPFFRKFLFRKDLAAKYR